MVNEILLFIKDVEKEGFESFVHYGFIKVGSLASEILESRVDIIVRLDVGEFASTF